MSSRTLTCSACGAQRPRPNRAYEFVATVLNFLTLRMLTFDTVVRDVPCPNCGWRT